MISSWEVVALAFLALLIFGPERLPEMARTVGRTVSRLRREASSTLDEIKRAADVDELREHARVDELRDAAREIEASTSSLRGADTGLAPRASADQARDPGAPAPFDPDAP